MRETESQARAKKAIQGYQRSQRLELRVANAPNPFEKVVARLEVAAAYAETKPMLGADWRSGPWRRRDDAAAPVA